MVGVCREDRLLGAVVEIIIDSAFGRYKPAVLPVWKIPRKHLGRPNLEAKVNLNLGTAIVELSRQTCSSNP